MSITKTENGWKVDLQLGSKRSRVTFDRKEDAVEFEAKTRREHQQAKRLGVVRCNLTFSELVEKFEQSRLEKKIRGFNMSERYRLGTIKNFFKDIPVSDLTLKHGKDYLRARESDGLGKWAIIREAGILKRIFAWAMEEEHIESNPVEYLKKPPTPKGVIHYLTDGEIERLLNAAEALGDFDLINIVIVAINTGFRKSNLDSFSIDNIEERFVVARQTKTDKDYRVPINEMLKATIASLIEKSKGPFLLNMNNAGRRLRRAARKAGLSDVTFLTLRHTFASRYVQAGVSLFTVSKWLGHTSVKMTEQHYAELSPEFHNVEIKKLPGLGMLRHFSDTKNTAPTNLLKMNGVEGIRTPDLCLDRAVLSPECYKTPKSESIADDLCHSNVIPEE